MLNSIHLFLYLSDGTQKQQAGRAGRRSRDSLVVLVADPFPVDQHYVQNPDDLFENSLDDLIIDIDNEVILEGELAICPFRLILSYFVQLIYSVRPTRCLCEMKMRNGSGRQ